MMLILALTKENELVLEVSLNGQSLYNAAQQRRRFWLYVFNACTAQLQLYFEQGLQTCMF